MTLCIIVADGVRPDSLLAALDAGQLPALARVRASGSAHTVTTCFPSVTGSAYTPFLMGLHPGRAGLPGLRWWDRAGTATLPPAHARSYVGIGGLRADHDLTREFPTLFEAEPRSLGGFTYVGRGLRGARRIGTGAAFAARMAWTHFRGDLAGWLRFDHWLGEEFAARVRRQQPRVAFLAHPGVDKLSHRLGHDAPEVLDALRTVDATVAQLYADAERAGRSRELEIWIVSDHGHEPIAQHDDLAGAIADQGYSVRAHPWVVGGRDVAVMVSGNAMAHLYLELGRRERHWWPSLTARWQPLVDWLLARDSVDLVLLPLGAGACRVLGARGESAVVRRDDDAALHYLREFGDPLAIGDDLHGISPAAAWERCFSGPYPDSLVQICAIASSSRAGDIIVSAAEGWDLRARWEPALHVSGHGALRRNQMLVPLLMSAPAHGTPRRTTDVFPSALAALGLRAPRGLDGESFR